MIEQNETSASSLVRPTDSDLSAAAVCAETGLALVRIAGEDATAFLNAQSTAAFDEDFNGVRFAALADAKGRVLLVFHAWHEGDTWLLALAAGEVEWLRAHLARFVFHSRVTTAPAPGTRSFGVIGASANAVLALVGLPAPEPGELARAGSLDVLGLAGCRWLVAGEEMALADAAQALAPHAVSGGFNDWKRARLLAGEVEISTQTRGQFLPQMLGLIELDAVSFHKGCYPGQEIIARAQHLGRVKRGLVLLRLDSMPKTGSSIEVEDTRLEVLDGITLREGGALVQAVAPSPVPE